MDKRSIERTEKIGPIVRLLEQEQPDWKTLSMRILVYLGLEELSYVLANRRQDWQEIGQSLLPSLQEDSTYIRVRKVLDEVEKEGGTLEEIAGRTGLNRMTISQTVNALSRGGIQFQISSEQGPEGAPMKVFSR